MLPFIKKNGHQLPLFFIFGSYHAAFIKSISELITFILIIKTKVGTDPQLFGS
jgi:hypothetical protein